MGPYFKLYPSLAIENIYLLTLTRGSLQSMYLLYVLNMCMLLYTFMIYFLFCNLIYIIQFTLCVNI